MLILSNMLYIFNWMTFNHEQIENIYQVLDSQPVLYIE